MSNKIKKVTPSKSKTATLTIKRMALADCKPHPRNPRTHPEPGTTQWDTLKASLEHDYFDPIVFNKRNGMLVSGHLRRKVLEASGFTHADVSIVSYDERTHIARMLAANRLQGLDDLPMMKDLLLEIDTGAIDMDLTGFDKMELERLMTQYHVEGTNDPNAEWQGMPQCENENQLGIYLIVRFKTIKEKIEFGKVINQKVTEKSKSTFYPDVDQDQLGTKRGVRYVES